MTHTRRTFGKLALASLPSLPLTRAFAATNSVFGVVRLGIGSYSFRGFKLDDIVTGVAAVPLGELELESWFVEPGVSTAGRGGMAPEQREALRQWRLGATSLDELRAVKKKFDDGPASTSTPTTFPSTIRLPTPRSTACFRWRRLWARSS